MKFGTRIDQLIEALQCLPGVGPKTAQRMTLHLLERERAAGSQLADALHDALQHVGRCEQCRNLSEEPVCPLCCSTRRDRTLLCIVETPADVLAIEQSGGFDGLYFVLLGRLSPLDGVGPEELGLDLLLARAREEAFREVVLATNPTVEGEATAYYISEQLRTLGIPVSRIAHGVPVGGELEFVDGGTLQHAFQGRKAVY